MRRSSGFVVLLALAAAVTALVIFPACSTGQDMEFGGPEDVQFATALWEGMDGYHGWPMASDVYEGQSPHGAFLRLYYSIVHINDTPYHVIVKDNFGGEGATMDAVSESPGDFLAAVTVMVHREPGYDPDNMNWFWVKYDADGTISTNEDEMALAGRVAKGMDSGCIACHAKAGGGDYYFTND
ncbi:MAG: hypothetical protein GF405_01855 [Candidatus Eisenbacteria bacterium]|nr:hypothetical protein [Candidatus Eisenbacteria bacterium]